MNYPDVSLKLPRLLPCSRGSFPEGIRMRILGVDPGLSGAVAILSTSIVAVEDTPITGKGTKRLIDAESLEAIIREWSPTVAIIETVHAYRGQGVSSSFRFGQALGVVQGVIGAANVSAHYVTPQKWKKHFGLTADKSASRALAIELYPEIAHQFSRVKDDGRAEALLIAHYYKEALA
jgi:crossover junction endodeoxyribonuclease RuvC